MKTAALLAGIVLSLAGIVQGGRYVIDYEKLAPYGKGFVWGSLLLLLTGIGLLYYAWRKHKSARPRRSMH